MSAGSRSRAIASPLLDPLAALRSAIDRARAELPQRCEGFDSCRREQLELAAGDVLRALVSARRHLRDVEQSAIATLDEIALVLGARSLAALGISGRLAG